MQLKLIKLSGDHNQCQGCKEFFNSTFAFDKHRTGEHGIDRRCLTTAGMQDKGMAIAASGFWVSSLNTNRFAQGTK